MLTLTVSHNIFLTPEERIALAKGTTIETVGVSVPVWFYKGDTSEPAVEVFGKYVLTNTKKQIPVKEIKNGWEINMPQLPKDYEPQTKPSDEDWQCMTRLEREQWYQNNKVPPTAKRLLDPPEGAAYLHFKEFIKTNLEIINHNNFRKLGKMSLSIFHIVEINTIDALNKSLI